MQEKYAIKESYSLFSSVLYKQFTYSLQITIFQVLRAGLGSSFSMYHVYTHNLGKARAERFKKILCKLILATLSGFNIVRKRVGKDGSENHFKLIVSEERNYSPLVLQLLSQNVGLN